MKSRIGSCIYPFLYFTSQTQPNLLDVQPLKGEFRLLVGNELNLVFRLFDVFFRARNLDFVTVHILYEHLCERLGKTVQTTKY